MISETSAEDASELAWFKSSYSDSSNSNECVEVATAPDTVHVRDSKNVQGPSLAVAPAAWAGFVSYAAAH
ncbi:DUF397 domain-containing protein [Streptomyces cyaneofuscatus]|uniref:DUF397 domain-containing protein n=1 Tax=Streptomyces cyaneofuscatus TaxID=66883 RepID=UPI0036DDC4C9